jgi:hypothetical protein
MHAHGISRVVLSYMFGVYMQTILFCSFPLPLTLGLQNV